MSPAQEPYKAQIAGFGEVAMETARSLHSGRELAAGVQRDIDGLTDEIAKREKAIEELLA
jgi:hypothetical protein